MAKTSGSTYWQSRRSKARLVFSPQVQQQIHHGHLEHLGALERLLGTQSFS